MSRVIRIACLCPTYKRPECLPNAVQCFIQQWAHSQPEFDCRLFVLDDAGQYFSQLVNRPVNPGIAMTVLKSHTYRYPSLPLKYEALVELANEWDADGYVIWEDDDIFLPWHLSNIGKAFADGIRYYRHPDVFSTYLENKQGLHLEEAAGRFHSSWAFTREVYEQVGGYSALLDEVTDTSPTKKLNFDQRLGALLRMADPPMREDYYYRLCPSYVYRWGNPTYHGSAFGESGYADLWERLGKQEASYIGELVPEFDTETEVVWRKALKAFEQFNQRMGTSGREALIGVL